jgi:hypothetical protein
MQVDTFYQQPKNSIDALFVGSSHYVRAFSPDIIYQNTGISSFNRSTELMSAQNQYLYVKDAFKTQKPKVVFLSATRLQNGYNDKRDMHFHFGMAKIKPSFDKLKVALNYQAESDTMYALDVMFPVFKYHYRWDRLNKRDFLQYSNIETRGQDAYWEIFKFDKDEKDFYGRINPDEDTKVTMDPVVKKYLDKTIEFCKDQGSEVVICEAPSVYWNQDKFAASRAIAAEHDVKFLDCNLDENLRKIGDDIRTDWHDNHEHVNGWGAYKFSNFISEYLTENFDLHDYRGEDSDITRDLDKCYEEYYERYHMFLPKELKKPYGYNVDGIKSMKKIPVADRAVTTLIYTEFEEKLTAANLSFSDEAINVSSVSGKSGKRYELSDGTCVLLVQFKKNSNGVIITGHNRTLDFQGQGSFSVVDPFNKTGYVIAFAGTKTKEQAMLLTDIYNSLGLDK